MYKPGSGTRSGYRHVGMISLGKSIFDYSDKLAHDSNALV